MTGLDGRHRNEDGRIEKNRGDTKIGNLKGQYPELKDFPDDATLGELRDEYHDTGGRPLAARCRLNNPCTG